MPSSLSKLMRPRSALRLEALPAIAGIAAVAAIVHFYTKGHGLKFLQWRRVRRSLVKVVKTKKNTRAHVDLTLICKLWRIWRILIPSIFSAEMFFKKIQLHKLRRWIYMLFLLESFLWVVHFVGSEMEMQMNRTYCSLSLYALKLDDYKGQPLIIVITPTRKTLTRLPDMTRLAQTLTLTHHIAWVVIENGISRADPIERLLKRSSIPFCYLVLAQTLTLTHHIAWVVIENGISRADPIERLLKRSSIPFCYLVSPIIDLSFQESWRWTAREFGLKFVTQQFATFSNHAVIYFADDDGAYDLRIFDSYIRNVQTIGVWAIGLAGKEAIVAPAVDTNGVVNGWLTKEHQDSQWPLDAPGFAINLRVLLNHTNFILGDCKMPLPQECLLSQLGLTKENAKPFGYNVVPRDVLAWQPTTVFKLKDPTKKYPTYGYVVEYDPPNRPENI
uniref:Galactosylgalactosylxylosylprotein 3-beta-glucuronosyltransferase n=1 Tax=Ascaris lumbricoides TaxID=6252 RepID=A0A0M3HZJ3_ASCLU